MTPALAPPGDELARRIRQQAGSLADQVREAPPEQRSELFFSGIRKTDIPYLPQRLADDAESLFLRSFDALFLLGRASVPLAVGLTMHQYNLAALATLPVPLAPEFEMRRKLLLETIEKRRFLLAISSFGENIKNRTELNRNVVVTETDNGDFVCRGRKNFQSMAGVADLLLFSGALPDGTMGMFYTPLRGRAEIEVGPPLFSGAMALTDTRPLTFHDLVLKRRNVLSLDEWLTDRVSFYATAWFEALVAAAYLGGAARALEEVRSFARSVHPEDDEATLAEVDAYLLDVGRLSIGVRTALATARSFGVCAGRYCRALADPSLGDVPSPEQQKVLDAIGNDLMDCGSTIKYAGTRTAQETVNGARALIGTRSMSPKHPIWELTEQIVFGPLHPTIPARFERSMGRDALGEEPYYGWFEHAFG